MTHLASNGHTPDKRNQSAFCFVNTFKQPIETVWRQSPVYNSRLAQFSRCLHCLSDKHLRRRVEIFLHPTYIVNTQRTWHYKQQCWVWNTSRGKGILNSRVTTPGITADLRRLCFFCDRQDCWLTTHRHQKFKRYVLKLVPCVITVLGCVLLWIHMFTDMIWRNLWRKFVWDLLCHSFHGWNSVAGRSLCNKRILKKHIFHNIVSNTLNISKITETKS